VLNKVTNHTFMNIIVPRRQFLRQAAFTAALFTTPGLFADLIQTPRQTEGPFYPDKLPLDTDNDLLVINEATTPALGEIAYVSGRVLDAKGEPIRDAVVEIWQCDRNGAYLHSGTDNREKNDKNFQGFGRFVTGSTGEYLFRTIRPVPYPGRTPHIHYKVKRGGKELLVTQLYVKGHPGNERDGIWRNLKGAQRDAVTVDFVPMPKSKAGELAAKFDLVLGFTPAG
jgi:protocatechuate 3,4-dioxygenase, beta subunit